MTPPAVSPRQSPQNRVRTALRATAAAALAVLALGRGIAPAAGPLTVRLDPRDGAPRWLVNGEPRRARVFWGAPGPSSVTLSNTPQTLSFEFVALGSSTNGTLHFRFGQSAGEIRLDDIRVTDLETGREVLPLCDFEGGDPAWRRDWTFWPTDAANTVGKVATVPGAGRGGSSALQVTLKAPPDGHWPDFHIYHHANLTLVEGHRYRLSLWAAASPGRTLTLAFYEPGNPFIFLGAPADCFVRQIQLAARAGVDFVSFPIDLPWPAPGGRADYRAADLACKVVLTANPKALLIPRIPLDPPDWWRAAHPGEVMQWENGKRDKASPASPQYRGDAARQTAALVEHLEAAFGDHVAGYHPCGQNTGEWFYEGSWEPALSGYSPADLAGWRQWLAQRYASDTLLRVAWADPSASRATAVIPSAAARHASPGGTFREPFKERALIDFAAFQQTAMAGCVTNLAHAIRAASGGRKLVFFFYGYGFEFGALPNGPAVAGHYALRTVLNSPDIDVLCSPISYFDRGPGGCAPVMSAAESVALAGKMWLSEDDTHTFLAKGDQPGSADHVTTLEATNAELARNLAQEACRNFGTWWMDLGSTGWFNDPRLWTVMEQMDRLDAPLLAKPAPFRPEVAVILDERAVCRLTPEGSRVANACIYEVRAALGRLGAPCGQYLLDDLLASRVPAKLLVFVSAWSLAPEDRARLARATVGRTCVWCYAPGLFDAGSATAPAPEAITGYRLEPAHPATARARPTAAGARLGLTNEWGIPTAVRPLFSPAAPGQEILAVYPDGAPAAARMAHDGGVSYFSGAPGLTSELLRAAAREAGVHLFTGSDCVVYANGPFLALHGARDGLVEVDTGRGGQVTDLLTGEALGTGPALRLHLAKGETRVLRCE